MPTNGVRCTLIELLVCRIPQVLCLRRQLQLLLVRHAEASEAAATAAGALEKLQKRQHSALHDVEVQLRLKQGQVGGGVHRGQPQAGRGSCRCSACRLLAQLPDDKQECKRAVHRALRTVGAECSITINIRPC
jgi:hypothetical protein